MTDTATLGHRIAQRRKMLSLSQEALGEKLGISRQAISKWEADASIPEVDRLIDMSRIFGVSVDWLLSGKEDPQPEERPDLTDVIAQTFEPPEPQAPTPPPPAPEPAPPPKRKQIPWLTVGCIALTVSSILLSIFALTRPIATQDPAPTVPCDHADLLVRIDGLEQHKGSVMNWINKLEDQLQDMAPGFSYEDANGKTVHTSIQDWHLTAKSSEDMSRVSLDFSFTPAVPVESAQLVIIEETSTHGASCQKDGERYVTSWSNLPVKNGYRYHLLLDYPDGTVERIALEGHGLSDLTDLTAPTAKASDPSAVVSTSSGRFWVGYSKVILYSPKLLPTEAKTEWSDLRIVSYKDGQKQQEKDLLNDLDSLFGKSLTDPTLSFSIDSSRFDCDALNNGSFLQMRIEGKLKVNETVQDISLPLTTWKIQNGLLISIPN